MLFTAISFTMILISIFNVFKLTWKIVTADNNSDKYNCH